MVSCITLLSFTQTVYYVHLLVLQVVLSAVELQRSFCSEHDREESEIKISYNGVTSLLARRKDAEQF